MRTVEQAENQAQSIVKEMGYTIISESNLVGYALLVKVDRKHGDIQLMEITKDKENPTYLVLDKNDWNQINKMLEGQ